MKKSLFNYGLILSVLTFIAPPLMAGELTIKNEKNQNQDITLKFTPEGGREVTLEKKLGNEKVIKLNITSADLNGKTYYSVTGKVGMLDFLGDDCRELDSNKDYDITFIDSPMGTKCIAKRVD